MSAPHGQIGLGGPGLWIIFGILAFAALGAVAVILDTFRRPDRFASVASRLVWPIPQGLYLAAVAWGVVARDSESAALAILVMLFVATAAQCAYVLRVVSPKRRASAPAADAEAVASIRPEDTASEPRSV